MSSQHIEDAQNAVPIVGAWHYREAMQPYVKKHISINLVNGYLKGNDDSILKLQDFISDNIGEWQTASGVLDAANAMVQASIENGLLRKMRITVAKSKKNKTIEIRLDKSTLPKDGQKVRWQTHEDINNETWKEGTFCSGDDIFCVGFKDTTDKWDIAFNVTHWQSLNK